VPQRVYSHRFLASSGVSEASTPIQAGFVGIIKTITIVNTSSTLAAGYGVSLQPADVTFASGTIPFNVPGEAQRGDTYELRVVLAAGEWVQTVISSDIDITVCGYLLEAL